MSTVIIPISIAASGFLCAFVAGVQDLVQALLVVEQALDPGVVAFVFDPALRVEHGAGGFAELVRTHLGPHHVRRSVAGAQGLDVGVERHHPVFVGLRIEDRGRRQGQAENLVLPGDRDSHVLPVAAGLAVALGAA
ncbi:hypothetical protein ACM75Z_30370 [Pseudomonas aeruginosa]